MAEGDVTAQNFTLSEYWCLLKVIVTTQTYDVFSYILSTGEECMFYVLQQIYTYSAATTSIRADPTIVIILLLLLAVVCVIVAFITVARGAEMVEAEKEGIKGKEELLKQDTHESEIQDIYHLAKTSYKDRRAQEVIHIIKKYDFDVNYQLPSSGLSLFLCACIGGNMKLIRYMLSNGADLRLCSHHGDSGLYLSEFGASADPMKQTDIAELLLSFGCPVNVQNRTGNTALHLAAYMGNISLIKLLLKHGADASLANMQGVLPMDGAISAGHMDAAKLLEIKVESSHVWDIIEPHTPPKIKLGLMNPRKNHLVKSSKPKKIGVFRPGRISP